MEERVIEKMEDSINKILDEGLNTNNLDTLYKLSKVKHMAKEDEKMNYGGNYGNYGNYNGRGPGYDNYGNYGEGNYGRGNYGESYGRQGRDRRYRGHEHLDRMYDNYGRYEEGRQRYGANEDTKKSLEYMLKSMEDFARMLKDDASSQDEIMMIKQTGQKIAQM